MTDDRIGLRPHIPWSDTVIYEAHVRGMTMRNQSIPAELRGTYAGFAHPCVIEHLLGLGATTIELLPVFAYASEPELTARGLTNYWGYNTVDYFAPHADYAATEDPIGEFGDMVAALHEAGLEVILDAVYNHTAPDVADPSWYLGEGENLIDFSGCGNTLDANRPDVQDFIIESLRFWSGDLGVDGFRFDLASALARDAALRLDAPGVLFERIAADPRLGSLKHILEPWDATPEGYALGTFGAPFAEWNDRFRDDLRDFWRGASDGVGLLASRMSGSSDIFSGPLLSINFVTAHDGFTLRDVVSYEHKHNDANGEDGRDGNDDNRSDNCGVEGDSDDPLITAARQYRAANLLASLLLSRGVPMIRMGDEFGHTQQGNNNAYCQDNKVSWLSWRPDSGWDFRGLIAQLIAIRPAFNGSAFLGSEDVEWLGADGQPMSEDDWRNGDVAALGMSLAGQTLWMDAGEGSMSIGGTDDSRRITPLGLES